MYIEISDLSFDTIIGILEHERSTPQRVIITCGIEYAYHTEFINYATVSETIKQLMIDKQFELIEEALEAIKRKLHAAYPAISTLYIKIKKPDILPDCEVSVSETYKF
jgi:dihydroneopterin aldolase